MVSTLEEAAPTVAVQALKQAAKLLVPSGQHGQGLGSSAIGKASRYLRLRQLPASPWPRGQTPLPGRQTAHRHRHERSDDSRGRAYSPKSPTTTFSDRLPPKCEQTPNLPHPRDLEEEAQLTAPTCVQLIRLDTSRNRGASRAALAGSRGRG